MLVDTHSRVYHGRTAIPTNVGAWTVTGVATAAGIPVAESSANGTTSTSGPQSVAARANMRLRFDHAISLEDGYDGGVVEYSAGGGASDQVNYTVAVTKTGFTDSGWKVSAKATGMRYWPDADLN